MRGATRVLGFVFAIVAAGVCWTASGQDPQPSLGDVARAARKDKEKNATTPKKVLTDDDLSSGSGKGLSGLGDAGGSAATGDANPMAKGYAAVNKVEEILDKLDPMERGTLAKAALLDNDVDFPDRAAWEEKLYAAKQQYVAHGRELVTQMRKILSDAQSLRSSAQNGQGKLSPQDPRAQEMLHRLQELVQDAVRTDSAYQAVVMEGWDRAKAAKH